MTLPFLLATGARRKFFQVAKKDSIPHPTRDSVDSKQLSM